MDVDGILDDYEKPLPLEVSARYALVHAPLAIFDVYLAKRHVVLRRGMGWLKGLMPRQPQKLTRHIYEYIFNIEANAGTTSANLRFVNVTAYP